MSAWKSICCPVDFSAASASAMERAAEVARWTGASLTLLHVDEQAPTPTPDATLVSPEMLRRAQIEKERQLAAWHEVAARLAGTPVDEVLTAGDPASEIVRVAGARAHDLVIMGTHGRTGRDRVPFGSVAQKVILDAPCPVLVVRSGVPREGGSRRGP